MSPSDNTPPDDGLLYYMPRQGILVSVVLDENSNKTISVGAAKAEPDYSQHFVLQYRPSLVGTNHVSIGVGPSGLLQTSGSVTTSGVSTIAKSLAADVGVISALGFHPPCRL